MGCTPPDGIRLVRARPAGLTRKMETSLLPALTANSQRPSTLKTTAPCDPRPLPVPVPPVATVPATVSVPSAARAKIATAFPDVRFIRVYTARSEEHTSELQSRLHLVCRLLLEKKKHYSPCGRRYPSDLGR